MQSPVLDAVVLLLCDIALRPSLQSRRCAAIPRLPCAAEASRRVPLLRVGSRTKFGCRVTKPCCLFPYALMLQQRCRALALKSAVATPAL
ncbi:hypothetical protein GUJ93_ZPchr0008g11428 [Zizania palustris]|uniref:Uncharacterized protein n=1 Tax=Zizania palustris TaxID=103762 RepID=A0A8J5RKZ7_ZIZPA|nr:hypothetical protein GUJ93_ZPchr0008g11428 [Zizania palustris]